MVLRNWCMKQAISGMAIAIFLPFSRNHEKLLCFQIQKGKSENKAQ